MKNIVLLTTKYSNDKRDAWLTNELAYSFRDDGHNMIVIVFSWMRDDPVSSVQVIDGIKVVRVKLHKFFYSTGLIGTALKVFIFPYWARIFVRKHVDKCDLLIANTPCITLLGLSKFFKRKYNSKAYLVLWDFFPFYLKDLGVIRNRLFFSVFRNLEEVMYRTFDRIGCMTRGNIDFLRLNYSRVDINKVEVLPLWAKIKTVTPVDKKCIRSKYKLPEDKIIAVYGGAMSIVQELGNLLDLARLCLDKKEVIFLFIGRGTEKDRLEKQVAQEKLTNVFFLDYVPRDDYQDLVQSCDIGLISLSNKLSVPSFPSKTIDYFKVALPVIASLDSVTDFGDILEKEIKAGFSVVAGENLLLAEKLDVLISSAELREKMGLSGRRYYEKFLSVENAKNTIISIL